MLYSYNRIAIMKKLFLVSFSFLWFQYLLAEKNQLPPGNAKLIITKLLCENKLNPMGVPVDNLRFSWQMQSAQRGQLQTAYQIVIAGSKKELQSGSYDIWNSAMIKTSQSILVSYRGKKLQAGTTYYWQVKIWDKNNQPSSFSTINEFTTGLRGKEDWIHAKWIGYEELPDSLLLIPGVHGNGNDIGNKALQKPVSPLFRKEFTTAKKIKQGLLFITGLGQYEASINGQKVSDDFLTPGWTYYDKTIFYNTYDVTNHLQEGKNVIAAIVGNGFYNINRERYRKLVIAFGMPKMICRLKIIYDDGSIDNIVSDEQWKVASSPITFNSIYGGEDYDARLEQEGWNESGFNDTAWKKAMAVQPPKGVLQNELNDPVKMMDSFEVKKITQPQKGIYLYDFGQNASGIIELQVKGKKGDTVKLIPAELITDKLLANQNATGEPFYFSYILKGDGIETWRPKFTYYGFRYVQVEGAVPDELKEKDDKPLIARLKLLHNSSSAAINGSFKCSNSLFNKIFTLINWAIKSNLQTVVTDCPHREKLSWLEQDYLMGGSIHYNKDIYSLYRKLVFDMIDAQTATGLIPDIAPEFVPFEAGFRNSPEWGSAGIILPWFLYNWYGDKDIVISAYPMMKRYIAYLEKKSNKHILSHGLGDWYDYGPKPPGEAQLTPKALTATAIYYYDVHLLSEMANLLQNKKEAIVYSQQAAAIKKAFNNKFFNAKTKVYSTGSQTAMAMPLCLGLADENNSTAVFKNLLDSILQSGKTLTAGDIGFHFLVKALDDFGASQLLYEMNERDDVPGYGYQLKKGATALTESWPALKEVSNNHQMLGHLMEWFYSGLAGIRQSENSVAYKHIEIRPRPVGDISFVQGSFQSPYGSIISEWKKENKKFFLHVQIPVNTEATIYLLAKAARRIKEGGKPIKNIPGIQLAGSNKEVVIIKVVPGEYWFEAN